MSQHPTVNKSENDEFEPMNLSRDDEEQESPYDHYPTMEKNDPIGHKQNGKVLVEAICALLKVNRDVTDRIHTIQDSITEISALRGEIISMNQKLDRLIGMIDENPEAKSSFIRYLLS